jgi:hypothetical protein
MLLLTGGPTQDRFSDTATLAWPGCPAITISAKVRAGDDFDLDGGGGGVGDD